MADRAVVFIHGIWMRSEVFWRLSKSLQQLEYDVHLFNYPSMRKSFEQNAQTLNSYVASIRAKRIDFVAHSLGGLLLLHAFTSNKDSRLGKVVLMGTPLRGSAVARVCAQIPILRSLLGKNTAELSRGVKNWSAPAETIMIAGTKRWGLGRLLPTAITGPSDGTVMVEETKHPNLSAHHEISESHTTMLYSREAMQIIQGFLAG